MTVPATDAERTAALAALAIGQEPTYTSAPAPIVRTGREVYAGGTVRRLLVGDASLTYRDAGRVAYADAQVGDVILVTGEQADRLDLLEVTVTEDADLVEVAEQQADTTSTTDEALRAMTAADLVAYVGQNPDERERVRTLELERTGTGKGKGPRATVLAATEETPEADDAAQRIAAQRVDPAEALVAAANRQEAEATLAGTRDEVDPVRDTPGPAAPLLDPLATIGTPDRPAGLNLP